MPHPFQTFVADFASAMVDVDARRPTAVNARTKRPYQPGIGPHTERQTVRLVVEYLVHLPQSPYAGAVSLEVPYEASPRSKCDVYLTTPRGSKWAIEVKMLRFLGDNGKPNDNILMHILSPYAAHRSAVTDCRKLLESGLDGQKGILIYGYDYEDWPMDPAIEAFQLLASQAVVLGERFTARIEGLVHPVHQKGRVFGWEILGPRMQADSRDPR